MSFALTDNWNIAQVFSLIQNFTSSIGAELSDTQMLSYLDIEYYRCSDIQNVSQSIKIKKVRTNKNYLGNIVRGN